MSNIRAEKIQSNAATSNVMWAKLRAVVLLVGSWLRPFPPRWNIDELESNAEVYQTLTSALSYIMTESKTEMPSPLVIQAVPSEEDKESWIELLAMLVDADRVDESLRKSVIRRWIRSSHQSDQHPLRRNLQRSSGFRESEAIREVERLCIDSLRKLCELTEKLPASFLLHPRSVHISTNKPAGIGGFADVYRGTYKGGSVAVKRLIIRDDCAGYPKVRSRTSLIAKCSHELLQDLCREVVIWRLLRHNNITQCYGAYKDNDGMSLVLEWMDMGTITEYLARHSTEDRLKLIYDVAKGLFYLHDTVGVMHGDVRCTNILINHRGIACLSDFNISRILYNVRLQTNSRGRASWRYMPPEVLEPSNEGVVATLPTREGDIYAFGMTMLEIFTGEPPFGRHTRDQQVVVTVSRGVRPSRPGDEVAQRGLSDDMWDLIVQCWQSDPQTRPSMTDVNERIREAQRKTRT
ncbi:hypothetical protein CERSUDRAFT_162806 [Gelatoporia subvermispora B]|uniref:Protein kinase domain-containing protein n=1 Tax=Ceriporiopsis subvermispora (strain B) TaxID=914234 RepID=M2QZZ6_CERS8|nr:hypothetical protein CERSUDRAFT_162806 [Gelatoporia subvermispora B]